MKIRFYNTPNNWWYVGVEYNKKYKWFYINFLTKSLGFYWGKNAHLIP